MLNHDYIGVFTNDMQTANKMLNAMKKYGDNKWWLSENGDYMAYMQVNEEVLLIEAEALQKNIESLLGREVPFSEFKMSPSRIREEVIKKYSDKYHESQMNDEIKTIVLEPIECRLHGLTKQLEEIDDEHIKGIATNLLVQPLADIESLIVKVKESNDALAEVYSRVGKALEIIKERAPELHGEISEMLMGKYKIDPR